jgi:hypothetical protein
MKELKDVGYDSRMKYNGEVVVSNVADERCRFRQEKPQTHHSLKQKAIGGENSAYLITMVAGSTCRWFICIFSTQTQLEIRKSVCAREELLRIP